MGRTHCDISMVVHSLLERAPVAMYRLFPERLNRFSTASKEEWRSKKEHERIKALYEDGGCERGKVSRGDGT